MKSLLRRALQQVTVSTDVTQDNSGRSGVKKRPAVFRNRKAGHLKRVRNERHQKSRGKNQSWKTVRDPSKRRKRRSVKSTVPVEPISLVEDAQLINLGKKIVQSRRSLMGKKRITKQPTKPVNSILFRDLDMDIKDIICS
ncbi:unnamed protein product [Echinostoma caproni]|uniref:40S ribosomal protein S19-binding protein 1 n=1 Tax=Echinostoma caproni TaxID=27848 RepID=A0A183B2R5_9TREM|nr:unnamed protein product [Echinostoma caproni]